MKISPFPEVFVGGSFSKIHFRGRPPDRKPLAFEDQFGDPRTNLKVFGDEVTFQKFKNMGNQCFECLVRPDSANPGPEKLRMLFPHLLGLSKLPQSPYGTFCFWVGWGGVVWGGPLDHLFGAIFFL